MTTEPITHFDDEAIDDFAEMMKEKMAISRRKRSVRLERSKAMLG